MILLVSALVKAEVDSYQGDYTIVSDKVIVEETVKLSVMKSQFSLLLPKDAQAIEVKGMAFNVVEQENSKKIIIQKNGMLFNSFNLKYITESLIEKTKDRFFILYLGKLEADKIAVKVTLPEGATLKYALDSIQPSIMPQANQVLTDGKSIIVEWDETDLEKNKALLIIYNEGSSLNFTYEIGIIVSILLLAFLVYLYRLRNSSSPKKKDLTRNLFEEEKAIVEILSEAEDHELWQKQLIIRMGLSKVKLSRKIRNLEAKGVVERIPYGNSNKVRLKE